jgi:WD40 repeat protein
MKNLSYYILTAAIACLSGCDAERPSSKMVINESTLASADFSAKSNFLAITDYRGNNSLWDIKNKKFLYSLLDNTNPLNTQFKDVYSKILLPDNLELALASCEHRLGIWNVTSGKLINNFATRGVICDFDVNHTGSQVLLGYNDRSVQLLNTKTGNLIWQIKYSANIEKVSISTDGLYAAISTDANNTDIWQITQNTLLHKLKTTHTPYFSLISPQNKYVLLGSFLEPVGVYDTHSGELIYHLNKYNWLPPKLFKSNHFQISAAQFSDDLATLITASTTGQVLVWEMQTGSLIKELQLPSKLFSTETIPAILAISFSEDRKAIYALTSSGLLYKWAYS